MTEALRNQIKLKNKLHTEAISSGDNDVMKEYNNTKRDLQSLMRNCEIKYYNDQLELNQCDMTKTCKVINNNNNNNNMYLKSSIQTSSIDYIKENIHITLNISSNIPIQ